MKLTLIGMSGGGKSYWSKKLEKIGFLRICCDDLIEKELANELIKLGYKGIQNVSRWMGQPYEARYKRTSEKYLNFEKKIMKKIIKDLKSMPPEKDVVIDTTGSVIYTGEDILKTLKKLTTVVFLDVPESVKREMYELYIKDPKPVVWGNSFNKQNNESDYEALARCYPKLLKCRSIRYKRSSGIKMDYFTLRKPNITESEFLRMIQNKQFNN